MGRTKAWTTVRRGPGKRLETLLSAVCRVRKSCPGRKKLVKIAVLRPVGRFGSISSLRRKNLEKNPDSTARVFGQCSALLPKFAHPDSKRPFQSGAAS